VTIDYIFFDLPIVVSVGRGARVGWTLRAVVINHEWRAAGVARMWL
jgi:hypothetical protein